MLKMTLFLTLLLMTLAGPSGARDSRRLSIKLRKSNELFMDRLRRKLQNNPKLVHKLAKMTDAQLARTMTADRKLFGPLGNSMLVSFPIGLGAGIGFAKMKTNDVKRIISASFELERKNIREQQNQDMLEDSSRGLQEAISKIKSLNEGLSATLDLNSRMFQRI